MKLSLATALFVACLFGQQVSAAKKPHILFILADDLGWNDVSYHGGRRSDVKTPYLDKLAKRGVKLENYYVAPSCGPTRAQFLSGKYTIRMGLHNSNLDSCTKQAIPLDTNTTADVLKRQGYRTHLIGKWHGGYHTDKHVPTSRGFDTFRGFLKSHQDHLTHVGSYTDVNGKKTPYPDYRDNTATYPFAHNKYSTTLSTDRAIEIIDDHSKNYANDPMFMYLSYQAPHNPLQVPAGYVEDTNIKPENRRLYAGMVDLLDDGVRQVVEKLEQVGMRDDTVIIFSSDNGGSNMQGASNFPLRGQKGTFFQGGVRAVGFVNSKKLRGKRRGTSETGLIHVTDWMPTFMDIAGGDVASLGAIDGVSQWNTLRRGTVSKRKDVFLKLSKPLSGKVKRMRLKTLYEERIDAAMIWRDSKGIDWKLMLHPILHSDYNYPRPFPNYDGWERRISNRHRQRNQKRLYDLTNDPKEEMNQYDNSTGDYPIVKTTMLEKLRDYQLAMVDEQDATKYTVECDPSKLTDTDWWGPWA